MEIVLAMAAFVGISLISVPRLRRRSRRRVRADAGKQWTTAAAARRHRRPAAGGTGARSGWSSRRTAVAATGTTTAPALATEPYDEWDDDLDWGGETAVAAPPAAPPAPLPESDLDWQLPGEDGRAEPEPDVVAVPATDEPEPVAAEAADEPDWDWEPVVSRSPQAAAASAGLAAAPTRRGRIRAGGRKVNPLALVALYAAFGIGLLVIAVSIVSGAVSGPDTNRTPRTSATVAPTPVPSPPAASGTASAEAKRLQQAFLDQRGAVVAQETAAVRDARAAARRARAARRKARAARRRAAARRAARRSTPARQAPVTPTPVTPVTPVTPAPRGGGGGGGGCEFCLE